MSKKIKIIMLVLGIILLLFIIMGLLKGNQSNEKLSFNYPKLDAKTNYDKRIFDDNYVHEINVEISKNDWKDLTKNPLDETKYKVNVVIDGIKMENVSIKTKGNSSLKHIAEGPSGGPAASRFSFKIDFGNYIDDQTYFGLDKLNLNNIYGDSTYLNDYISYDSFKSIGVATPLNSFAYLKINNRNLGLYLAVEEISTSFLKRNNLEGNLYKPEKYQRKDEGVSLKYRGDDISKYASLFTTVQNDINEEDEKRLIHSIKLLNKREQIDTIVDTDKVIRYFAAHNFLLSYDSYTGKSFHNYYLIENNGVLTMLPWDYNLAFGRFNMLQDITTIVNYGIDSPLNSPNEVLADSERPMWNWILQDSNYLNEYHKVMNELITNYYESGKYEERIDRIYNIIKDYRSADISSFYTQEETEKGITTLKEFCDKRAKSIRLQLDGKLSTITDKQDSKDKIDASNIDLNDMGLVADDRMLNQDQQQNQQQRR